MAKKASSCPSCSRPIPDAVWQAAVHGSKLLRCGGCSQSFGPFDTKPGLAWLSRVRREALRVAAKNGTVTSDDLRRWADANSDYPHHPNAWGAVFRSKGWATDGLARSNHPTNHARRIFIWKRVPA